MKLTVSQTVVASALLAGSIAAVTTAAPPSARSNPLQVSMVAATGKASDFLGAVEVRITNTSRNTVRVPKWQLPSDFLEARLFQVSRDGKPVQYEGPMIKRPLPSRRGLRDPPPGRDLHREGRPVRRVRSGAIGPVHRDLRLAAAARLVVDRADAAPVHRRADDRALGAAALVGGWPRPTARQGRRQRCARSRRRAVAPSSMA